MKRELTYNELWVIEQDIVKTKEQHPALYLVNERTFLTILTGSSNAIHFKVMHSRMNDIQVKYIKQDGEGNFLRKLPEGEEELGDWDYKETVADIGSGGVLLTGNQVKEAYLRESADFLGRSVTIEF